MHPSSTSLWVERRAAPKPAHPHCGPQWALVASKPTQVGLEPRHSPPSGGRSRYAAIEGLS